MTDKQTYLQILDRRSARQSNLSILTKLLSMIIAFYFAAMGPMGSWRGPLAACLLMLFAYLIDTSILLRKKQYDEKFKEFANANEKTEVKPTELPRVKAGKVFGKPSSVIFYLFFLAVFISETVMIASKY